MAAIFHGLLLLLGTSVKDPLTPPPPHRVTVQLKRRQMAVEKKVAPIQKKAMPPAMERPADIYQSEPVPIEPEEQITESREEQEEVNEPQVMIPAPDTSHLVKGRWLAGLRKDVEKARFYPRHARRMGQQGAVVLLIKASRDGTIISVKLHTSSGFHLLDEAAVKAVERMVKTSPIPSELNLDFWEILVPLRYTIE